MQVQRSLELVKKSTQKITSKKGEWPRKIFLSVLFVMIIFLSYFAAQKHLNQDEGVFLTIAQGLSSGKLPYQDFFDHKPPAIYFALYPITLVFNQNILAPRIFLFFIILISAFLIFKIAEDFKKGSGFAASLFFAFLMLFYQGTYILAEPFIALFVILSYWCLIKSYRIKTLKYHLLGGVFIGITLLFKQTSVIFFLIFLFAFLSKKRPVLKFLSFLLGVFIPLFAIYFWLNSLGLWNEAVNQIVTLTANSYPKEDIGKVLSAFKTGFWRTLPIWLLFISSISLLFKEETRNRVITLLTLSILPIPLFLVRPYLHYWIIVLPFVAILAGVTFEKIMEAKKEIKWIEYLKFGFLAIAMLSFYTHYKWLVWTYTDVRNIKFKEQKIAAKYVNSLPEEYLLAETQFTGLNYLTNKKMLNKYLYITEITEAENSQAKTLEGLKNNSQTTIVIWPHQDGVAFATDIENYLKENFKPTRTFEELRMTIWTTK
jgi:hypothetical protein